jgi:hypothetical protein
VQNLGGHTGLIPGKALDANSAPEAQNPAAVGKRDLGGQFDQKLKQFS